MNTMYLAFIIAVALVGWHVSAKSLNNEPDYLAFKAHEKIGILSTGVLSSIVIVLAFLKLMGEF